MPGQAEGQVVLIAGTVRGTQQTPPVAGPSITAQATPEAALSRWEHLIPLHPMLPSCFSISSCASQCRLELCSQGRLWGGAACICRAHSVLLIAGAVPVSQPLPRSQSSDSVQPTAVSVGWGCAIAAASDQPSPGTTSNIWSLDFSDPTWKQCTLPGIADVVAVAAGDTSHLVLDSSGAVWSWGHQQPLPKPVPTVKAQRWRIVQVACGGRHAAAITRQGEVLTWGSDSQGALGHGSMWKGGAGDPGDLPGGGDDGSDMAAAEQQGSVRGQGPQVVRALQGLQVSQVACGSAHTLALTASGDVYSWGSGSEGQLGLGTRESHSCPVLVEAVTEAVTKVSAGARHSVMLTQEGRVLACGFNGRGQLGLGDVEDREEPCEVPLRAGGGGLWSATDVEAGWWHTLVLVHRKD